MLIAAVRFREKKKALSESLQTADDNRRYIHIRMHVRMHVCMYVCVYACTYALLLSSASSDCIKKKRGIWCLAAENICERGIY